jgi:hypothetical protein
MHAVVDTNLLVRHLITHRSPIAESRIRFVDLIQVNRIPILSARQFLTLLRGEGST